MPFEPIIGRTTLKAFPRWIVGRIDPDLMEAAAVFSAWSGIPEDAVLGAERMADTPGYLERLHVQEGTVEETHHLLVEDHRASWT